jgi:hypothetical protein
MVSFGGCIFHGNHHLWWEIKYCLIAEIGEAQGHKDMKFGSGLLKISKPM